MFTIAVRTGRERLSGAVLYRVREGSTGRERDLHGPVQAQRKMFRIAV